MTRRAATWLAVAAVLAAAGAAVALISAGVLPGHGGSKAVDTSAHVQGRPPATVVSLTFDDAYENQWRYAAPLLRSHHMTGTFYVINSDSDGPYPCCMSFSQLRTLQGWGNDIGGHGMRHLNLTGRHVTYTQKLADVCQSRADLLSQGIDDPVSYAYPFGSYNRAAERVVARCGFAIARQGGGISSSTTTPGAPWAETLPPKDPEAVRTIAVDGANPIQLSDLEAYVTQAAAHGGGWLPITFHDVCDAYAPDYTACMSTFGPVWDTTLGEFLDWLRKAGRPGGAPAGVVVRTMRGAMYTVHGPDTRPPSTAARCDGAPCLAAYPGPVRVSLLAADPRGTGVAKTHFTVNGPAPTTSSPAYQTPFVLRHSAKIRYFSVDNAGNAERVRTITIKIG